MKRNFIFLFILTLWSFSLFAQTVPSGMNYQAVARDLQGQVLKNQPISLQISLKGNRSKVAYAETHRITTSELGLFTIVIGEGQVQSGDFSAIPWSSEEVWMELAIDEAGGEDYVMLSSSRLLAVPYAFHAGTASEIVDDRTPGSAKAPMKDSWQRDGNEESTPGLDFIGNRDAKDLIIKTNSIERIRILANGGVSIADDLTVSSNLNVGQNLDVDGSANVDVDAHIGQDLDVDGNAIVDGNTHIGQDLDVDGSANVYVDAHIGQDLDVDGNANVVGTTHIGQDLDVDGNANVVGTTHIGQDLDVDGSANVDVDAHIGQDLDVDGNANVVGTTHIGQDLDVDGSANVDVDAHIGQDLDVDNNANVDVDLTVGGNASFANDLNVGGNTALTGSLYVTGLTTLSTLNLGGMTSSSSDISGDQTVGGNQSVGGDLAVTGEGSFSGLTVSGPGALEGGHVALFENTNSNNADGIAIKINKNQTNRENNFVTFYRGDGGVAGRIEGYNVQDDIIPPYPSANIALQIFCDFIHNQSLLLPIDDALTNIGNVLNTFGTQWNNTTIPGITMPDFPGVNMPNVPEIVVPEVQVFGGLDMPSPVPNIPKIKFPETSIYGGLTIPNVPGLVVPDIPSLDFSAQIGTIPHIPTFDEFCATNTGGLTLQNYLKSLIEWAMTNDFQSMLAFSPKEMAAKFAIWGIMRQARDGGVTYGSEGADYAEYLPRQNENEIFMPGDIVGIYGGEISKKTEGADQVLAISSFPIVLGNAPGNEEERKKMEKVGFLGQVPVYVMGKVEIGDFIIPSGKNDGIGVAVAQDELTLDQMKQVLGKAWSASTDDTGLNLINVSIGVQTNEWAELLSRQQTEMNALRARIDELQSMEQRLGQVEAMLGIDGAKKESARVTNK